MFSWSKKKDNKKRDRSERESEENEFGIKLDKGPDDKELEAELKRLAGVESLPEDDLNVIEGEEDVESELLRLIGGGKGKKPSKKVISSDEPLGDISELTAEIDLGDEDVEVDEDDPELLGELLELTNPGDIENTEEIESDSESESKFSNEDSDTIITLKERLNLYKTAEAKAKESGESSRSRRFARGIKTLEDLIKKAKLGKAISPSDIPPVIALNLKPPSEVPTVTNDTSKEHEDFSQHVNSTPNMQNSNSPSESGDLMNILVERLKLYQTAEAKAKENGEISRLKRFGRGIKTLENLIKQAQAGNPVAPEDIPPVVALNLKPPPPVSSQPVDEDVTINNEEGVEDEMASINLTNSSDDTELRQEQDINIMDTLSERLQMYKTAEAKAKEDGETSRVRRFTRAIKTLQNLIKQATEGKLIPPDEIPPPVALNLKHALSVTVKGEPKETVMESENLLKSSEKPISFTAVDDVNVDEELAEDVPTTVLEGLEQRARLYMKFQEKVNEEKNSDKAVQNEKIVRVYLNAIKTFKRGGYVDVEKLPNPNGYPPIPIPFFIP